MHLTTSEAPAPGGNAVTKAAIVASGFFRSKMLLKSNMNRNRKPGGSPSSSREQWTTRGTTTGILIFVTSTPSLAAWRLCWTWSLPTHTSSTSLNTGIHLLEKAEPSHHQKAIV